MKEERLVERSAELGHYLFKTLKDTVGRHELVGDIRGKGLMIGIELVGEKKAPAVQETNEVLQRSLREGIIIGKTAIPNVLRLTPPLVISKAQIDQSLEILDKALSYVEHKRL